jgi:mannitol/fructose-specific phosphotransferase system IIA component (Ntr-type)
VDFSSFDKQKVHTLFLILSSSFKGHLALLSRLAFCLQNEGVKAALDRHANREEILATFQVAESKVSKAS